VKVLLLSGIYPPDIGGPATNIPEFAKFLLGANHSPEVITLKNSDFTPGDSNWPVKYINRNRFLLVRVIRTIVVILKRLKSVDSVFANGLIQETGISLLIRPKWSVVKMVGDPVWERAKNRAETELGILEFNQSKLKIKHRIQREILVWSLNNFNQIICPSLQLKSIIENWGVNTAINFIPNGVKEIDLPVLEKDYDLVTVCRIISLKNCDKMISSCKETSSSLAIVGDGPDIEKLKALAQSLDARVTFFGNLEPQKVFEILLRSRIYLNFSDHEGLSFALLEAMACGLPSIVSKVPGNMAVIDDGIDGYTVDIKDTLRLNQIISNLLTSVSLQNKLGQAAINKIKDKYSQNRQLSQVVQLLEQEIIK